MNFINFGSNCIKLLFAVIVLTFAVYFHDNFIRFFEDFKINSDKVKHCINNEVLLTEDYLSKYNGIDKEFLYLSLMGVVFDVTKGKKHYEEGAAYHYFIGHDGSRAFVTGNFKDRTATKDHILDLPCEDISALIHWKESFNKKYVKVGMLHGRYFDENCHETQYSKQLVQKIEQCRIEKEKALEHDMAYPPCNIAWSAEEGTRVWCTKTSGGVSRGWAGVPRQMYTPGKEKPRCVCLNLEKAKPTGMFKEYDQCPALSDTCTLDS